MISQVLQDALSEVDEGRRLDPRLPLDPLSHLNLEEHRDYRVKKNQTEMVLPP